MEILLRYKLLNLKVSILICACLFICGFTTAGYANPLTANNSMTEKTPEITLGIDDDNKSVVFVEYDRSYNMKDFLALLPGVKLEENATMLALALNHFARETEYDVIEDPKAFEEKYRATLAKEDPKAPFDPYTPRLSNYGTPDFATIQKPKFDGKTLVFYAVDIYLGLPYKITAEGLESTPSYEPLPMTPLSR